MNKLCTAMIAMLMVAGAAQADLLVSRRTLGVERYTDAGAFLGTVIGPGAGGLDDATGIAVGPGGDIFVADVFDDQILRYNSAGAFVNVFASGPDIENPFDISFGPGGDLFVGSSANQAVIRVDGTTGSTIGTFTSGNATPIGGFLYMVFGPELIVTDSAGHVFRFDAATGAHIATGIADNPEGVDYDPSGNLYIAQRISDNVIRRPSGGGPVEIAIDNGAFPGSPADLAMGPGGLLYLATSSNIHRFDVSATPGVLVDSFGSGGEYLAFAQPIPEPGTLLLTAAGLLVAVTALRRRRPVA